MNKEEKLSYYETHIKGNSRLEFKGEDIEAIKLSIMKIYLSYSAINRHTLYNYCLHPIIRLSTKENLPFNLEVFYKHYYGF